MPLLLFTQKKKVATTYDDKWYLTSLLMDFNNNIYDFTNLNKATVTGRLTYSNSVTPYVGTSSAVFESSYVALSSSPIKSKVFTIEAWVYSTGKNNSSIYSQYTAAATGRTTLYVNTKGCLEFFIGSATNLLMTDATTFPTNTWVHVAVTRDIDGNVKLYRNGLVVATGVSNQAVQQQAAIIGYLVSSNARYWQGNMADLRVTNGSARYNGNFNVPSTPYPKLGAA